MGGHLLAYNFIYKLFVMSQSDDCKVYLAFFADPTVPEFFSLIIAQFSHLDGFSRDKHYK